jgi:hypothetical protein
MSPRDIIERIIIFSVACIGLFLLFFGFRIETGWIISAIGIILLVVAFGATGRKNRSLILAMKRSRWGSSKWGRDWKRNVFLPIIWMWIIYFSILIIYLLFFRT